MITTTEYQELLASINLLLGRTRLRGTIQAGDIANSIFIAHPKMALRGLKKFVKRFLNKEVTDEQNSRLNAKALLQKKENKKNAEADKKATDPQYKALCNKRTNDWEKKSRKNKPAWKNKRNKKQRLKKRQQKKDRDNLLPPS